VPCSTQTHQSSSVRFHPFQSQSRSPNLAHRTSVPALFHAPHNAHTQYLSAPSALRPIFPLTPTSVMMPLEEEQQRDVFSVYSPATAGYPSRGTIWICSALFRARWHSHQTQSIIRSAPTQKRSACLPFIVPNFFYIRITRPLIVLIYTY
jgi:hypothetical protein